MITTRSRRTTTPRIRAIIPVVSNGGWGGWPPDSVGSSGGGRWPEDCGPDANDVVAVENEDCGDEVGVDEDVVVGCKEEGL